VTGPAGSDGQTLARAYQLVVFDLDGVVYLGTEPIAGAAESIESTVDGGTPVTFVTNNASRRAAEVAQILRGMGVKAREDEVLTSAQAAAELLAADLPAGSPVLVVGAPALAQEIQAAGLTAVARADARPAAVVQGYGPEVGWALLAEACVAVRSGAQWVATNTDATLPSPRGPLPGNGSLVAVLVTALNRTPDVVVGKPEPTLLRLAAEHRRAGRVLVVGDRLDTDIEGASRAGMDSLLVLTGVATPADLLAAPVARRPTFVAADCRALSTSDHAVRVPAWDGHQAVADRWRVTHRDDRLELAGDGDAVSALRALAAAAWAHPEWTGIVPDGDAAGRAVTELGLGRFAGWAVTR
jgi:HAD superfamily hydrolase (TIGR01450 family)